MTRRACKTLAQGEGTATLSAVDFFVFGQAVAKQSYRAVKGGGYTDPRVKAWQATVRDYAALAMRQYEPITCPVRVRLEFYLKDRRRVDCDNLSKGLQDGLNGIVWQDDSQVCELLIIKRIDRDNPRVGVSVQAVTE